jgi:Lhr-like helicase/intein/homing endonuclease
MVGIFNILDNRIKELAVSRFEKPTLIQELAIPKVLEGKNILVIAETGSGKTESVMLGLFNKLIENEHKPIALLYLTPLKSLNRDLMDRLVWWCNKLDIDISVRHGDTTQYERKMQLEHPPHILISTIEQIGAMLIGKRFREHLRNIKYIVIDEVHEIVNSKRGVQLTIALERLKRLCGNPQIVCLSATVGSPDLAAKFIFSENKYEIISAISPKSIELKIDSPYPTKEDRIIAEKIFIGESVVARLRRIRDLILEHRSTLTFTNTREAAEILSSRLRLLDKSFPHEIHHSSLSKEVRIKAEKDFKEEKLKSIICTSSLQLGLDIGSVDLVLQYQSPRTVTQLTQRCLPANEQILMSDGSYKTIEDIVENNLMDIPVISYVHPKGFLSSKIIKVHKYFDKELIKIKLKCGEEILCTREHPILTLDGWKIASNINKDDKIGEICYPLLLGNNIYIVDLLDREKIYVYGMNTVFTNVINTLLKKQNLKLIEFCRKYELDYENVVNYRRRKGRKKAIRFDIFNKVFQIYGLDKLDISKLARNIKTEDGNIFKTPLYVNEELMWLLGLTISDGYFQSCENGAYYKIRISNKSEEVIRYLLSILEKFGIKPYREKRTDIIELSIANYILVNLFMKFGLKPGKKSKTVNISNIVFKLPNEKLYAFLKGLLDGDGCVTYRNGSLWLRFLTSSKTLAYNIVLILSRLGYHSSIHSYKMKTSKIVKKTSGDLYSISISRNKDVIDFLRKSSNLGKVFDLSFFEKFKSLNLKKFEKFIVWEGIDSIEQIKYEKEIPVYNLTLNGEPTFIVGRIITHNCGRSGHGVNRISKGIIIASEGDDIFESAVIARKVLKGELEPLKVHRKSLDVLTQQLIGLAMEEYGIDPKEAYQVIRRAYPFKDLKEEEFLNLLNFLDVQLRLIFSDNGIKKRRRALEYYFENLSVIPDQKSYKIIDTTSNSFVGTLDEEFIASHGDAGSSFIVKGRPWKILSVENEKVFVESVDDIESAIPAWEGELIPVPFDVAQEVGVLRREIQKMIEDKTNSNKMIENLKRKYPVSPQTAVRMIQLIKRQIEKCPLPDEKNIIIERFQNYIVLHALFGSLVNETLSRFISAILSAEHGEIVTSKIDPYRIILKGCSVEEVKKILSEYKPEDIEVILEKSLPRSSLFKFRFIHVAKRFGAISKKASFDTINIDRMIDVYWNSPIHKETLQELFTEKLDLEKTKEVLEKIQNKRIKIESFEGLSPLAELGFRYELQDVAKPERPEKEIFKIFKNRLLNSKVRLLCINCGKYSISEIVKDVEEPRCRLCQSKLIAAETLKGYNVVVVAHAYGLKEPGKNELEEQYKKRMKANKAKIFTGTHALSSAERAVRKDFGTIQPLELIANVLRRMGEGTKVCVEVTLMAADAGLIPVDRDIIAIGGTGRGADTALRICPANSAKFFDLKIREIIAKPRDF